MWSANTDSKEKYKIYVPKLTTFRQRSKFYHSSGSELLTTELLYYTYQIGVLTDLYCVSFWEEKTTLTTIDSRSWLLPVRLAQYVDFIRTSVQGREEYLLWQNYPALLCRLKKLSDRCKNGLVLVMTTRYRFRNSCRGWVTEGMSKLC